MTSLENHNLRFPIAKEKVTPWTFQVAEELNTGISNWRMIQKVQWCELDIRVENLTAQPNTARSRLGKQKAVWSNPALYLTVQEDLFLRASVVDFRVLNAMMFQLNDQDAMRSRKL